MNKQPFPKFLNIKPTLWGFEVKDIMISASIPLGLTYVGFPDEYTLLGIGAILAVFKAYRTFAERGSFTFKYKYKFEDFETNCFSDEGDDNV